MAAPVAIGVGAFALVTTEFLPVGLLPQISHAMVVSDGSAGLAVTLSGFLAAISAPLTIAVARQWDRRIILLVLLGTLALSNMVVAIAPTFMVILIGRVILGMTIGAFWTVAGSLGPRLQPGPRSGLATAIILSGVSLGTVAGVPAGSLLGDLLGWRIAFMVSGALALLVLVAVAHLVPPLTPDRESKPGDLVRVLRNRAVRFGLAGTVISFVGQFAGYTYIAPLLIRVVRIDAVTLSAVLFGFGLAGVAGNLLGGWAVGKSIRWTLVGTLLLLGAAVLLLTMAATHPVAAIMLILVWGLGFGMQPIATQSWMFSVAPDQLEEVMSVFVSAAQFSIGAGALAGGLMVDHLGVNSALLLAAATAILTAAMFGARR